MRPSLKNSSLFGGIIAAFLASICCVGPVVFALMGLAGVGFITSFEPYRPYFIALTLMLLAAGFYLTYRKRGECDPDSVCANPKVDRRNKILLWSVSVIALVLILSPYLLEWIL